MKTEADDCEKCFYSEIQTSQNSTKYSTLLMIFEQEEMVRAGDCLSQDPLRMRGLVTSDWGVRTPAQPGLGAAR